MQELCQLSIAVGIPLCELKAVGMIVGRRKSKTLSDRAYSKGLRRETLTAGLLLYPQRISYQFVVKTTRLWTCFRPCIGSEVWSGHRPAHRNLARGFAGARRSLRAVGLQLSERCS